MKTRIVGFDYLRILCAILVVAIHSFDTNPSLGFLAGTYFNKFAVPLFLIISFFLFFEKEKNQTEDISSCWLKRCRRLAPAFIIWTTIYIFTRITYSNNVSLSWDWLIAYCFLGSAAIQLYYIPLTLYYAAILLPILKIIQNEKIIKHSMILAVLVFIVLSIDCLNLNNDFVLSVDLKIFLTYFNHNAVYAVLGLCIGYYLNLYDRSNQKLLGFKNWLSLPILAFCLFISLFLAQFKLLDLLSVLFVFLIFYYFPFPENTLISKLSKISFGIYLSHHLFIEGLQAILAKLNYDLSRFDLTIMTWLISTILSIGFSWILYSFKKTKFLVV